MRRCRRRVYLTDPRSHESFPLQWRAGWVTHRTPVTQPGRPRCPTPLSVSSQLSSNRRFQVSADLPWQHVQVTHSGQSSTPSFFLENVSRDVGIVRQGKAGVASVYTRCLLCSAAIKIWHIFSYCASMIFANRYPKIQKLILREKLSVKVELIFLNKKKSFCMLKMAIYCPQGSGTLRQQLLSMHCISWYCMVLHGIAWYCIVLHGIA